MVVIIFQFSSCKLVHVHTFMNVSRFHGLDFRVILLRQLLCDRIYDFCFIHNATWVHAMLKMWSWNLRTGYSSTRYSESRKKNNFLYILFLWRKKSDSNISGPLYSVIKKFTVIRNKFLTLRKVLNKTKHMQYS